MAAPYSRDTLDAKFAGLRHEFRADLNAMEGRITGKLAQLEGKMNTGFETLRGELRGEFRTEISSVRQDIAAMRGEWKVWFLVFGTAVAVLSSGVGNRMMNLLWPADSAHQPGAAAPFRR